MYNPFFFTNFKKNFIPIKISLKLCEPSSIIISNSLILYFLYIWSKIFLILFSFFISTSKTLIFLDLYLKFEIFTSKQKTFDDGRYFAKAAADAPA